MAVEKPQEKRGKKRPIWRRRTRLQHNGGMAFLCHASKKNRVESKARYRLADAAAVTGL